MSANSSNNSLLPGCYDSSRNISVFTSFFVSYILLFVPLFALVLYVGYKRWRKQRSVATAATTSHSDIFTFNMVGLELISILGCCFFCYGMHTNHPSAIMVGLSVFSTTSPGQTLFHLLTCVEHYLAVVHPVTYMGLRQSGGVRIRNISVVCVWLLCLGSVAPAMINSQFHSTFILLVMVVSIVVISFCSLSVLCVLIRPGPGEVGGHKDRVDQSKQRAFHTIMVIMSVLLLRLFSSVISNGIHSSAFWSPSEKCLVILSSNWFNLPSSLVLPLLFLHRAGKLPGCKNNSESG